MKKSRHIKVLQGKHGYIAFMKYESFVTGDELLDIIANEPGELYFAFGDTPQEARLNLIADPELRTKDVINEDLQLP